jgi:membrane protein required for colicin V production
MTALDIIVYLLVGGGLVLGFMRGFVGEMLALLVWVAVVLVLRFLHTPFTERLEGPIGTWAGAAVLAFAILFAIVFFGGRLIARQIGGVTRRSAVGPVDKALGAGFGMLKGLIGATLLYLGAMLVYDTIYGRYSERPAWLVQSRTWPLLHASGRAIVDFVEQKRNGGEEPSGGQGHSAGNAV